MIGGLSFSRYIFLHAVYTGNNDNAIQDLKSGGYYDETDPICV